MFVDEQLTVWRRNHRSGDLDVLKCRSIAIVGEKRNDFLQIQLLSLGFVVGGLPTALSHGRD
jgi:hypothetical protein